MATIKKIPSKNRGSRYRVRIRRQGHKMICATFDRKVDADAFVREYDTKERATKYLEAKESKKHTIAQAIDRYLKEDHLDQIKTKDERIRQLKILNALFGHMQFYYLTKPAKISEIESTLRERKGIKDKKISSATINRYFSALSHLCQVAYEQWHWIESNPFRNIRRKKENTKHGRTLTDAEFERLKSICESNPNDNISIIVILALCTGMRKGEIRFLRWQDLNLASGTISLKDTKNGSSRTTPISEPALSMLKDHSKVRDLKLSWVFVGENSHITGKPFPIDQAWRKLKEVTVIKDFRFHDLRHTCASFLAKNNVSARTVSYTHLTLPTTPYV